MLKNEQWRQTSTETRKTGRTYTHGHWFDEISSGIPSISVEVIRWALRNVSPCIIHKYPIGSVDRERPETSFSCRCYTAVERQPLFCALSAENDLKERRQRILETDLGQWPGSMFRSLICWILFDLVSYVDERDHWPLYQWPKPTTKMMDLVFHERWKTGDHRHGWASRRTLLFVWQDSAA